MARPIKHMGCKGQMSLGDNPIKAPVDGFDESNKSYKMTEQELDYLADKLGSYNEVLINKNISLDDVDIKGYKAQDIQVPEKIQKKEQYYPSVSLAQRAIHLSEALSGYLELSSKNGFKKEYIKNDKLQARYNPSPRFINRKSQKEIRILEKADHEFLLAFGSLAMARVDYDMDLLEKQSIDESERFIAEYIGVDNETKRKKLRKDLNHQKSMANDSEYRDRYQKKAKREIDKYSKKNV